ncbi:MAG: hypothetical protein ACYC61_04620 [Isosphaeraceae bacterium]
MRRISGRPRIGLGSAILALFLILMPTEDAGAQFMGYGYGYPGWGYGGWGGGYPGWGYGGFGYGYPVVGFAGGAAYTYPGLAFPVVTGYQAYGMGGYGGWGWGYPGYGYGGMGYGGMGYGAYGYMSGGIGMSGVGFWNPMFGVGLTPLGTQSYLYETRMLGRVPRVPTQYGGGAYGRYGGTTYDRGR